jgi:Acyltransferase family
MSNISAAGATARTFAVRAGGFFPQWKTDRIAYPLGYMAALDGARGLMTLGVLLAHTRMALFQGAAVYMDVFFAMSGYLITSLLIADYQKRGHVSLKKFYTRRFLRLYPALATMVILFVIICWFFSNDFQSRLTEAAVTFFYLMDYWRPFVGTGVLHRAHLVACCRRTVLPPVAVDVHRAPPHQGNVIDNCSCDIQFGGAVLVVACLVDRERCKHLTSV